MKRVAQVREVRLHSKASATRKSADRPLQFFSPSIPTGDYIAIPEVSSEQRRYIPIAILPKEVLVSNKVWMVESSSRLLFGILISNVHNAWMRVVSGRMKSDYSYSAALVYNTFPWPHPSDEQIKNIEKTAENILKVRENHSSDSLADLYDPLTMPPDLLKAHQENDKAVMTAYGWDWRHMSESDCVAKLMEMYEKLCKS